MVLIYEGVMLLGLLAWLVVSFFLLCVVAIGVGDRTKVV